MRSAALAAVALSVPLALSVGLAGCDGFERLPDATIDRIQASLLAIETAAGDHALAMETGAAGCAAEMHRYLDVAIPAVEEARQALRREADCRFHTPAARARGMAYADSLDREMCVHAVYACSDDPAVNRAEGVRHQTSMIVVGRECREVMDDLRGLASCP